MTYQAQGPYVVYIHDVEMTEEPFLLVHPTADCTKTVDQVAEAVARMLNERDDLQRAGLRPSAAWQAGFAAGLERAAAYHDEEARDCRSIAAVNEDNELGPDCTDYAIQHDADAEAIRALKQATG